MRVRTQGTPPSPRHMLAMSPYFYLNELLVQVIRTPLGKQAEETLWSHPLGYPCVYVGVFPRRIYSDCIHPDEKVK
jgi:hypothetical protein